MSQKNTSWILPALIILCVVIFVGYLIVLVISFGHQQDDGIPQGKVAASHIEDGQYYVYIESINSNPEDTTVTFEHVTYFQGTEAKAAAVQDGMQVDIHGSYVRESGAPDFTAPLQDHASSTVAALRSKSEASPKLVFLVTMEGGNVKTVVDVTDDVPNGQ